MSQTNVIDLTSYLDTSTATDALNENRCYFKAYQNLSQLCLEPYRNEITECEKNPDSSTQFGCKLQAEQKAFRCILEKMRVDTTNYSYNHCSGPILNTESDIKVQQALPPMKPPSNPIVEQPTNSKPEQVNQPSLPAPTTDTTNQPQKRRFDRIFTIFRKKQD